MTYPKTTLDEYAQTREEGKSKLQPLFYEKQKRREALKIAFADEPEKAKIEQQLMRVKLNTKWQEDNKDLISRYQELYQQKTLNEDPFKRGLEEFKKLNPEVDVKALKHLLVSKAKTKKSIETTSNLPSAVAIQENKAIAYFKEKNEPASLQVVEHIQKLRALGKITYENLSGGRYTVTMPCGNKTVKMYFPPDTSLADTNYRNWLYWKGDFTDPAIRRDTLWSTEGQEYLKQKEKQGQKLLFKADFLTLLDGLYPAGDDEKGILAFMMATGFYGRIALADGRTALTDRYGDKYQLAVRCYRHSDARYFDNLILSDGRCSLVHSSLS